MVSSHQKGVRLVMEFQQSEACEEQRKLNIWNQARLARPKSPVWFASVRAEERGQGGGGGFGFRVEAHLPLQAESDCTVFWGDCG